MTWAARAFAVAAWAAPAVALAEPLVVEPRYVPRVHPPGRGATADAADVGYFYVAFSEEVAMTGAGASIVEAQPRVSTADYHSLAEISVEDATGNQIIEIGWNVDPVVNPGSVEPHLFAFHWVNGVGTCYNGCGYVQVSADHAPGSVVEPSATPHTFQIQHRDDARWWLTYDGEDLGYYPDTEWTNPPYTEAEFTQWFGEVAAGAEASPCTEMGNGIAGTSATTAASYAQIYTFGSGSAQVPGDIRASALTLPAAYSAGAVTGSSFAFGGPGIASTSCVYDTDLGADFVAPDVTAPAMSAGCCEVGGGRGGGALLGAGVVALVLRRRRANRTAIRQR